MGQASGTSGISGNRPTVRILACAFLFLLAAYLSTATYGPSQSVDSAVTASSAWSLGQRGTLDLSDVRSHVEVNDAAAGQTVEVDDRLYTNRFPGAILAGTPFYALALFADEATDEPNLVLGGVAAAVLTASAMTVLLVVFRRIAPPGVALGATIAVAFGTSTWSVSANALWTHGPAQLWLALGMLAFSSQRYGTSGWAWALALLTRPHLGVVAATTGIGGSLANRSPVPAVRVALTTSVGLVAWLLYGRLLFGQWTLLGGYSVNGSLGGRLSSPSIVDAATNFWWLIVHPVRGFLLYTPALLWLLPAIPRAWRATTNWVRISALAGILYLVAQAYVNRWQGGDAYWAYRYSIETLTLLAPLMVVAYQQLSQSHRRFVLLLTGLSIVLQVPGAVFGILV